MPRFKYDFIRLEGKNFQQITRTKAMKIYKNGEAIYIQGCNANLRSPWIAMLKIKEAGQEEYVDSFNTCVNAFMYYLPSELGKRPIFFKEVSC